MSTQISTPESESIIPSHTADVRLGHQLLDNESLIGVWIELSELSTASLNIPTHTNKKQKTKCVSMYFSGDMIIDQNVRLYFCKYLIDFTSKLCYNLCTHHQRFLTQSRLLQCKDPAVHLH